MNSQDPKGEWTISGQEAGERLDKFLTERLPELTRSQIQKMIADGRFLVNGEPPSKHRFLKTGDLVAVAEKMGDGTRVFSRSRGAGSARKTRASAGPVFPQPRPDPLIPEIVEETESYIVLDKPAGLLVHPASKTREDTLVDFLVRHYPPLSKVGEDPNRPGIVHRLDREVSGLMVVAKTQRTFDDLKRQFASRLTDKTYLALVHGEVTDSEGDLKFRIARSKTRPRMAARPSHEAEGKAAWTHYCALERYCGASLLELHILSGRMHQIRAHLIAFGHPVIGDSLYVAKRPLRNIKAPRLMLQSIGLSFNDPDTGERRSYRLEPDAAFEQMRQALKGEIKRGSKF